MASALKIDEKGRENRDGGDQVASLDSPAASERRSRRLATRLATIKALDLRRLHHELDLRLLLDRRVRRLAVAHLTSAARDGMVLVALPFAILAAGGSDGQFSVALTVQALAMAFLFLPSGVIGDRFNRRAVVVASDLMRFGVRGIFAALLITGDAAFWQLLVAQAVNGAGTALFSTTMDGFVPEVFDGEARLQKVNALRILALSLGMTLGPKPWVP